MGKKDWKELSALKAVKHNGVTRSRDFTTEAYMEEFRKFNRTKKIYAIDPYVEVYHLRDNVYSLFTENCDAGGAVFMHLIIGPEKALLIDTAYGLGDTKALVDGLTGNKPLIVVNTHNHCDHAYGNCRFDTVYCHKYELPYLEAQDSHIWDYLFDENGRCRWLEFDRADLPEFKKYQIVCFEDMHVFDLGGGYEIQAVWLGGHTPGHCGYLDKQNRIFFSGDDIVSTGTNVGVGPNPNDFNSYFGEYMNITTFRSNLIKLMAYQDQFDTIFPQHGPIGLSGDLLPVLLTSCDEILENPEPFDYKMEFAGLKGEASIEIKQKFIPGLGVFSYTDNGL